MITTYCAMYSTMKIKILDLLGLQLSRWYQGLIKYFYENANGKHYFWIKRRLTKRINVSFSAVFTSSSISKLFDLKNANSHRKESFCNCVPTKVSEKMSCKESQDIIHICRYFPYVMFLFYTLVLLFYFLKCVDKVE